MTKQNIQATLDRILAALISTDRESELAAISELETIAYSSSAIVNQLERLAIGRRDEVGLAALQALSLRTSQAVVAKSSVLDKRARRMILTEIDEWKKKGLIQKDHAEVLKRQYDFDIHPGRATDHSASVQITEKEPAESRPPSTEPAARSEGARTTEPRPSLTQILLSENSVRVYLYLGAFFVISAAAILAAVIEAARLPILLIATLIFAGGALGLKKRLPQPSFALAVIFSFLLPINANVLAENLDLSVKAGQTYWAVVYFLMAIIWGLGTWLYTSRMFSLASLIALMLCLGRVSAVFSMSDHWTAWMFMAALIPLLGITQLIQKRQGRSFILPMFIAIQVLVGTFLLTSLVLIGQATFIHGANWDFWLAHLLIWIFAAILIAFSDLVVPFALFPWMSVAALFLVPSLFLSIFDASRSLQIAGITLWGSAAVFVHILAERLKYTYANKYSYPLLALSVPLFAYSLSLSLIEGISSAFVVLLAISFVYTVGNLFRPRWFVWSLALLAIVSAYFLFFELPITRSLTITIPYQLLFVSVILLIPELFFSKPLTLNRSWSWPPLVLGVILAVFNFVFVNINLVDGGSANLNAAVITVIYAVLFFAYAMKFRQPALGYPGAAFLALAGSYTTSHFELDLGLQVWTVLSVVYYGLGYSMRGDTTKAGWGGMWVRSGLVLGLLLAGGALLETQHFGGWYVLIIAALFTIELFKKQESIYELFVQGLLAIATILILPDLGVFETAYTFFSLSLVWFTSDIIFHKTLESRKFANLVRLAGGVAAGLFLLLLLNGKGIASGPASVCVAVYTIYFLTQAWIYDKPGLGFASTGSAVLSLAFAIGHFEISGWLFLFTGVAVIYYLSGSLLRSLDPRWSDVLRFSGLALGVLLSFLAPFQEGGLERVIPIAIAASLFAAEAYAQRNVWFALPANLLYLTAYFTLLVSLNVRQPQYFSIGAALLGMLMHYLLTRAGSKTGAFLMGSLSQLTLLGTSYIQMVSTSQLGYFFVLFFQSLVVIFYGLYMRSRSLVFAPIGFVVIATLTVLYSALKNLSVVIIIGASGILLITLGILAVLMRERITSFVERFEDWNA